jgi:hypothetical protein
VAILKRKSRAKKLPEALIMQLSVNAWNNLNQSRRVTVSP